MGLKKGKLLTGFFIIFGCSAIVSSVFAGLIDYERLKRIQDRRRLAEEAAKSQAPSQEDDSIAQWMIVEPKVKAKIEGDYDVNHDGKLQAVEVKIFLRYVLGQVREKGGYTHDSDVLMEYDKNKDGLISRLEAEQISKDAR